MSEDLDSLLAGTTLFGGLDAESRSRIARQFQPLRFGRSHTVFSRGAPGTNLYLIGSGSIRLSIVTEEGRELSVRIAGAGEIIGEIAVFDRQPRTADAVALAAVQAYGLSKIDLDRLLGQIPQLSRNVIDILCRKLRETTDQMESIALYPIEARLARFLLIALKGQTAKAGKRVPLELGFSQSELAQLLGASRPKVNIALGVLEKAGAVGRTSDRLFCEPAILSRIAESMDE